jgi:hypothetical protein
MYNINDNKTQSVAQAVKQVIEAKEDFKPHTMYDPKTGKEYEAKTLEDHLKMKDMGYTHEKPSEKNETEVQDSDKDIVDLHAVDKKDNPEKERQVEEKEAITEAVDNFFGFSTKDGLVKFQSMAKKLKIKPISNPVVMKRGGKEFHVMGFEGSVRDIEKAMKVAAGMQESSDFTKEGNEFTAAAAKAKLAGEDEFEFDGKKYPVEIGQDAAEKILGKKESVELQEAANFGDIEKVMKWAKKNLSGAKLDISKKYGTAFINLTIMNVITLRLGGKKGIVVTHDDRTNGKGKDYEEQFSSASDVIKFVEKKYNEMPKDESANLEEAIKPADFVKGGDAKVTKREVDGMLSKLFIDSKLAKAVESNAAYQDGYKGKVKKNPFKKDTADFHLFELGQQSADAE